MNLTTQRFYDVEELADLFHCCPETVRRHIRTGRMKATTPGRKALVPQKEVERFLHERGNFKVRKRTGRA